MIIIFLFHENKIQVKRSVLILLIFIHILADVFQKEI